jgi:hypothetical protein
MSEYDWDVRCADLELRRLQGGFTQEDWLHFAGIATLAHNTVVNDIHVETGSLRESTKLEFLESTHERWSAQISVGGASFGVKNPVRYAASEFFGYSTKYGGPPTHSYMKRIGWTPTEFGGNYSQGVPVEDDMIGPVTSFFSRGRRTPHPEAGGL